MLDERGQAAEAVDWAAVRAVYEAGQVSVRMICYEHRITPSRLRRRYIAEGWRVRPQVARPGQPSLARRPVEAAIVAAARVIEAQAERLIAAPGPAPAADMTALADMVKALERTMREDRLKRQGGPGGAGRKSSTGAAAGGGPTTAEEMRAADVAYMRAELKRRLRILAGDPPLGEGAPDRPDGEQGA